MKHESLRFHIRKADNGCVVTISLGDGASLEYVFSSTKEATEFLSKKMWELCGE